jgi:hypothetical protein
MDILLIIISGKRETKRKTQSEPLIETGNPKTDRDIGFEIIGPKCIMIY